MSLTQPNHRVKKSTDLVFFVLITLVIFISSCQSVGQLDIAVDTKSTTQTPTPVNQGTATSEASTTQTPNLLAEAIKEASTRQASYTATPIATTTPTPTATPIPYGNKNVWIAFFGYKGSEEDWNEHGKEKYVYVGNLFDNVYYPINKVDDPPHAHGGEPIKFSQDGKYLAYTNRKSDGATYLNIIELASGTVEETLLFFGDNYVAHLYWDKIDSTHIAYQVRGYNSNYIEYFWINLETQISESIGRNNSVFFFIDWLSDKKEFAYYDEAYYSSLVSFNPQTNEKNIIFNVPRFGRGPTFSGEEFLIRYHSATGFFLESNRFMFQASEKDMSTGAFLGHGTYLLSVDDPTQIDLAWKPPENIESTTVDYTHSKLSPDARWLFVGGRFHGFLYDIKEKQVYQLCDEDQYALLLKWYDDSSAFVALIGAEIPWWQKDGLDLVVFVNDPFQVIFSHKFSLRDGFYPLIDFKEIYRQHRVGFDAIILDSNEAFNFQSLDE
jgi:hypothetical protein